MFYSKQFMKDTNEDNEIIQITDDYQELNEESLYLKDNENSEKNNSKYDSNISNSYKKNNHLKYSNIDIDPNFIDGDLIKEEKRRLKEIEEFEKRTYPQNYIIDFDEMNKKGSEIEVEEEGIIIDNFNYFLKTKKNIFSNKKEKNKNNNKKDIKTKICINENSINNDNKSEDSELKITQIRNNRSYEKDDMHSSNNINKEKPVNIIKSKNNVNVNFTEYNGIIDLLKDKEKKDININNNNNEYYNMEFYNTNRQISKENNSVISSDDFDNLITNKAFKKFLKNKIRYYMNENEIPKEFLDNLKLNENTNNNHNIKKDKINYKNHSIKNGESSNNTAFNFKTIGYYNYYNEGNLERTNSNEAIKNNKIIGKRLSKKNMNYHNHNIYENNTKFFSNYDKILIENKLNKEKIENLKIELDNKENEMNEKINKINVLENINDNLKNEMNKLQINFEFERLNNKESKNNYNIIKSNYTDIKNKYDLLNIKYLTLSDENFNFKRDKDLYEKQIKSKNEIIENLLENNSYFKKNNINDKLNKINNDTKTSNIIISDFILNDDKKNFKVKLENNKETIKENENDKKINYNKFNNLNFPELQCKRDELIRERKDTYNIYGKIPFKSTSKEQIIQRNMLEKKIEDINYDLMLIKLKIKNYKTSK